MAPILDMVKDVDIDVMHAAVEYLNEAIHQAEEAQHKADFLIQTSWLILWTTGTINKRNFCCKSTINLTPFYQRNLDIGNISDVRYQSLFTPLA